MNNEYIVTIQGTSITCNFYIAQHFNKFLTSKFYRTYISSYPNHNLQCIIETNHKRLNINKL